MLGSDKDTTHNGGNQCKAPRWSITTEVPEEILLRDQPISFGLPQKDPKF